MTVHPLPFTLLQPAGAEIQAIQGFFHESFVTVSCLNVHYIYM